MSRGGFGSALVAVAAVSLVVLGSLAGRPAEPELETIVFVDYASHSGPGPHPEPESCSGSFRTIQGGLHLCASASSYDLLEDTIPGELNAAAVAVAVASSFSVWSDEEPSAPVLTEASGSADTVSWAPLGTRGAVAVTSISFNPTTKVIAEFHITFNSQIDWSLDVATDTFDVQNSGTHEVGHVYGLDHVNAPKDGMETMYRFTTEEETNKRTLCDGDIAGINELY